jgi:hypothetical protein
VSKMKLSERISSDQDVPDWLIISIEEIEAELEELRDRVNYLEKHPKNCDCRECKI